MPPQPSSNFKMQLYYHNGPRSKGFCTIYDQSKTVRLQKVAAI